MKKNIIKIAALLLCICLLFSGCGAASAFLGIESDEIEYTVEKYLTDGGQENFRANVFVNKNFVSYGQGSTKREAEQNAAKLAIKKLNKNTK